MQQAYRPSAKVVVKNGNTFSLFCSYTDETGIPLPLTNATITAEVRNQGKTLISQMTVTLESDYTFRLSPPTDLPSGVFYTDVRIVENGVVRNSNILQINVVDVVTNS